MPNILLTTRCNLSCKYCFAQEKLSSTRINMPIEAVQKVIDFLKRSQFPIFRVMGGEPTLHPQFNEIIQLAIANAMRVDVLSNATWSKSTSELFGRIPSKYLMFLLNIDHPDNYKPSQWAVIQRNLSALKGRGGITLSFNVFEKEPRSGYILDLANTYDFKYIRLSLSLPVMGAGNACLPIEELPEIAPFVVRFVAEAEARGIGVQFDNAVPLCIFTEAQIGYLLLHGVYDVNRNARCDPIIDIGPDLTIWSCFCLSALKNRKLDEFQTLAEAQAYFRQVWSVYQDAVYPLEKCTTCFYRTKWGCQGGCLSYAMMKDGGRRYDAGNCEARVDILARQQAISLADDVHLFHFDIPKSVTLLRRPTANLDFELDDALQPILPLLDGRLTVDEIITVLSAPSAGTDPLRDFMQMTLAENLPALLRALLQQGFLKQQLKSEALLTV